MAINLEINNHRLTISLSRQFVNSVRIWIFDSDKRIVSSPSENRQTLQKQNYLLPRGKYIVRVEINGQVMDNDVDLISDKSYNIDNDLNDESRKLNTPPLYSSALLSSRKGYKSSHEYYTEPAMGISELDTYTQMGPASSGLFIFLRFSNAETYINKFGSKNYWNEFSLLDAKGKVIIEFPNGTITDNNNFPFNYYPGSGYIGFSAPLPMGHYYLKYSGKNARQFPIHVFDNWYTQYFMTVDQEPLFGSARIFISKDKKFDPYDELHTYVDICLDKLQNNDFTLDDELLNNIAFGKYDSPMLGLLGAYIYLNSNQIEKDNLFEIIVQNLQKKILINSDKFPDIWALNILSYKHFNKTLISNQNSFVSGTPMLRIAFDTIRNAATRYPWLVPEGSLNDLISENQVFDSPFNTFKPFKFNDEQLTENEIRTLKPKRLKEIELNDIKNNTLIHSLEHYNINKPDIMLRYGRKTFDNVINSKLEEMLKDPVETGWIGTSIANILRNEPYASPVELATRMNLPVNTVLRVLDEQNL